VAVGLLALLVSAVAVGLYLKSRPPGQGRVSVTVLPLPVGARVIHAYTDCSRINSVTYEPHEPCQTFALVSSAHFSTLRALYDAELSRLRNTGWRPAPSALLVDNHTGNDATSPAASWTEPHHQACAVVLTDSDAIAAERKAIFPYDPYDIPHGRYRFYRQATSENLTTTLWVGLIPDADQIGRRVC
jgi:hypothetical protein